MTTSIVSINGTPLTQSIQPTPGGFKALGVDDNKFVVFSLLDKRVHCLGASDLKEMDLKARFGALWCDEHYSVFDPKKSRWVFDHKQFATDILTACQAAGPYSRSQERKLGVWKTNDGQLMVNSRELWLGDGTVLEHGIYEGRVYPACNDIGFGPDTPPATTEEINKVLAAFNAPQWKQDIAGELLLGFIGVSFVSVALRRRPHLLMTGPAACGKSTTLEIVRWLLGGLAHACTGPQTLAALYQSLGGTSKVTVLDEFEADATRRASKDIFEAARMSYSLQEGDEGIVRGTVTGKSKSYQFFSPFIAAGISPARMEPADITRWVVLEAFGKPKGPMLTEAEARDIGPKLARRFILGWDVFQATEASVRQCILKAGGDNRLADTVGTLLASYWTFVSDKPATEAETQFLVEMLNLKEQLANHQITDESQCMEALTSRVLTFKVVDGASLLTRQLSIGQAIEMVCKDPTGQPEVVNRLAQLGLRVAQTKGKWSLFVVNSHTHQELRKLFSGTKWATGGWAVVLRRLPGGEESTQRIGAGLGAAKVTVIDVPQHLLPSAANDDDMKLVA